MGTKRVETLRYFRVLKANFTPQLYDTTPSPKTMLDFLSLELASFLCSIEKGEGGWLSMQTRLEMEKVKCCKLTLDSFNCLNYFCRPL